jgi:Tfp pilus assembly pilus retraction ATPase PilT
MSRLLHEIQGLALAPVAKTDLLIQPGKPVLVAVPAAWTPATDPISADDIRELAAYLLQSDDPERTLVEFGGARNVALQLGERRMRVDVALFRPALEVDAREEAIELCVRILPGEIPKWLDCTLPAEVKRSLVQLRSGLVLVNGPTGSGKTTAMVSLLQHISTVRAVRIITLEDPIEFIVNPHRGVVSQREHGRHFRTFASAARAAYRQQPGIVLISEVRDAETAEAALELAQSCLVLATTHATYTIPACQRICELLPDRRSALATTIKAVLSLALVPSKDRSDWVQVCEWVGPDCDLLPRAIESMHFEDLRIALRGGKPEARRADTLGLRSMNEDLAEALAKRRLAHDDVLPISPDRAHLHEVLNHLQPAAAE